MDGETKKRDPTALTGKLSGVKALTGRLTAVKNYNGEFYAGDYEVTPKAEADQVLETKGKLMNDDVTVKKIPVWETSNESNGLTVYIAEEA